MTAPPAASAASTSAWAAPGPRAQRIGLGVALAIGLLDAWRYVHYQANPDGVSYIDLALAFTTDGPAALVNGYWSPLLPALLGLAYRIVPPTLDSMYAIAHVAGVLPFLVATWTYHRLLTALRTRLDDPNGPLAAALAGLGWVSYLVFIVKGIGLHLITPDMGVAAVAFWLAREALELGDAPWSGRRWIVAGLVLGVGYWWKAILFPVGAVWFVAAAAVALRRRDPWRGPVTGAAAYAAVSLVLIVPVSLDVGRPTFGETGRLNYLWYANVAPYVWERCLPRATGEAAAAPFGRIARDSVISEAPLTCAIDSPLANATMPLWDDPSRYYRDAHTRFDAPRQMQAVRNNVVMLQKELALLGPVTFLMTAAFWLAAFPAAASRARARIARAWSGAVPMVALVVAPIGFYLIVYVEFRHIAPFVAIAAAAIPLAAQRLWKSGARFALACAMIACADFAWQHSTQTLIGLSLARATALGRAPERVPDTQLVARALRDAGIAPGSRVASYYATWNAEWAQLAGLRIRAHVPDLTVPITSVVRAWRDPCAREAWDAALRAEGIVAAVARIPTGISIPPRFERLAGTEFHLTRVAPPGSAACAAPPTRSSSGSAGR